MHDIYLEIDDETIPGDPPTPLEQRLVDFRHHSEYFLERHWLLWEGERVLATSGTHMHLEQNLDNAWGWVNVRREARGRGLARMVAAPMLDLVQERDRRRFAVGIPEGSPYSAIAERGGLKDAFLAQHSRLLIKDVDWDLVDHWIEQAPERASEYELLFRAGRLPEEELVAFCSLHGVMNTAPQEDFEEDPEVVTPEIWRSWEEQDALRQVHFLIQIARHKPTGELVGLSELIYQRLHPAQAYQANTGVLPDHREKGLGRWLKAAMLVELREAYPEIERIDTDNAGSNEPMLNINVALGFKPILREHVWQGDTATLRERLAV
jgi:GNAT superfamily N-acetyltransferase